MIDVGMIDVERRVFFEVFVVAHASSVSLTWYGGTQDACATSGVSPVWNGGTQDACTTLGVGSTGFGRTQDACATLFGNGSSLRFQRECNSGLHAASVHDL